MCIRDRVSSLGARLGDLKVVPQHAKLDSGRAVGAESRPCAKAERQDNKDLRPWRLIRAT